MTGETDLATLLQTMEPILHPGQFLFVTIAPDAPEPANLRPLMRWIDDLYLGGPCPTCQRRDVCPDPIA